MTQVATARTCSTVYAERAAQFATLRAIGGAERLGGLLDLVHADRALRAAWRGEDTQETCCVGLLLEALVTCGHQMYAAMRANPSDHRVSATALDAMCTGLEHALSRPLHLEPLPCSPPGANC